MGFTLPGFIHLLDEAHGSVSCSRCGDEPAGAKPVGGVGANSAGTASSSGDSHSGAVGWSGGSMAASGAAGGGIGIGARGAAGGTIGAGVAATASVAACLAWRLESKNAQKNEQSIAVDNPAPRSARGFRYDHGACGSATT